MKRNISTLVCVCVFLGCLKSSEIKKTPDATPISGAAGSGGGAGTSSENAGTGGSGAKIIQFSSWIFSGDWGNIMNSWTVTDLDKDNFADAIFSVSTEEENKSPPGILVAWGDGSGKFTTKDQPIMQISKEFAKTRIFQLKDQSVVYSDSPFAVKITEFSGTEFKTTELKIPTIPKDSFTTYEAFGIDLDGDGLQDVLAVGKMAPEIVTWRQKSPGNFELLTASDIEEPLLNINDTTDLAIADINGDKKMDIIATSLYGGVRILTTNGDGTFNTDLKFGDEPSADSYSINVGDINHDNEQDIVILNKSKSSVKIFVGSNGKFSQTKLPFESAPSAIAIADLDQDGLQEFIFTETGRFSVVQWSDDGSIKQKIFNYETSGFYGGSIKFSDVNGDKMPDMISIKNDSFVVFINETK